MAQKSIKKKQYTEETDNNEQIISSKEYKEGDVE